MPGYEQTLITAQVDGAAYGNSTTANTPLQPVGTLYTFPAGYFTGAGKTIRVRGAGRISGAVAGPTLNLGVAFGSVATPIIVFAGGANALVARATTNVTWVIEVDLTIRAIGTGTSANAMGIGKFTSEACLGSAANAATVTMLPLSAPAVGTGFDSTLTQVVQLVATWGTAAAGNTITCHQFSVEDITFTP